MADRLVTAQTREEDATLDNSLRPRKLADFVGQEKVKENLRIAMQAAVQRGEPLDHVLFYGPPGMGKTTLAGVIAAEMGVNIKVTSGPAIERAGDMAAIVSGLRPHDLLFIDEVHRLGRVVEEVLYPAMEDFFLSWVMGKGLGARTINIKVPPFTLVGATTRFAAVAAPLRSRFGIVYRLDFYDQKAIQDLLRRSAAILGVEVQPEGVEEMARRSRGTPRIANRLLKRVRDYAQVAADGVITGEVARKALGLLEIDDLGLDQVDHQVLSAIVEKFDGGPVGLETIAACINEEADTIMDVYEPYLMQLGFLSRTPRGRVATRLAYSHLGLPYRDRSSSPFKEPPKEAPSPALQKNLWQEQQA
jgi:Holliday junction DNA helicase RuvB